MLYKGFFTSSVEKTDPEIFQVLTQEVNRQKNHIEMIASENIVSMAVLEAQGSALTNKYAEGYPDNRYYGGCKYVDIAEEIAIKRAKKLFHCQYANVQPHSGTQANAAVMFALCKPGDCILGMSLDSGGHLTHGAKPSISGKWFQAIQYSVCKDSLEIDYTQIEDLAVKYKPKLIIAGGSALPRKINFDYFYTISQKVNAFLLVDMAHFAGLVAGKVYPNPIPYADVVTTTTHKTLRGPRGGLILSNNRDISKKINSAVFPGIQGGPLMHTIAAKAVAFGEALRNDFKLYTQKIIDNAKVLASTLDSRGFDLVTGGTDTHLILIDLRKKSLKGNEVEYALEQVGITCNKNSIPFDLEKHTITSGIRLGTSVGTTRGFGRDEFIEIGHMISDILDSMSNNHDKKSHVFEQVRKKVQKLCIKFPLYKY